MNNILTITPHGSNASALFLLLFALPIFSLSLLACSAQASNQIVIFAASSLTDAFGDMALEYERRYPDVTIRLNFAGSSQLATQLIEGAPADLFASANEIQMERLVKSEKILAEQVELFASNHLVLIIPKSNQRAIKSLHDLSQPGLKLVTAAKAVPIGRYTREALKKMEQSGQFQAGFEQAVLANIVSEEANVRQMVTKVQLGEADAAIVYQSDVTADLSLIPIPEALNIVAHYPIAPLDDAPHLEQAAHFIAFIQSPDGQAILQKWGFVSP
jgi:molybdate transport system substrate-binding protein